MIYDETSAGPQGTDRADGDGGTDWYTSGMVIHDDHAHLVTVHRSYLVMDTLAWALAQADAHEQDAETATGEDARGLNERIAHGLRCWAAGEMGYLDPTLPLWALVPAIAVRARIGLLVVDKGNFPEYMAQLMARAVPARSDAPPTFLLHADPEGPVICATNASSHMVDFASGGILARVVSEDRLWHNYSQLLVTYKLAHQGEDGDDSPMAPLWRLWGERPKVTGADLKAQDLIQAVLTGVPPDVIEFTPLRGGRVPPRTDAAPPPPHVRGPRRRVPRS